MPDRPLRIAIYTSGRFHVCHLARELCAQGHDVKFYSLVPPWRTAQFGLPKQCNRWMLPYVSLAALRLRFASGDGKQRAVERLALALDRCAARRLEPCDIFIGMSGLSNETGHAARDRFGAHVWIERGSTHILTQQEILGSIPGARQVSDFAVERELQDYEQAQRIAVLSRHCEESFLEQGMSPEKLVRNPLGVDLDQFQPTPAPPADPPTAIMTGTWSLRKGCDTLTSALSHLSDNVRLIHVGPVDGDCPLPDDSRFEHVDKVDQPRLREFYSKAHVFALASREEGLATVQPQALACGLRLVCTKRTGGEDLIPFVADPSVVTVTEPNNVEGFATALQEALKQASSDTGLRELLGESQREELSWAGYGRRYSENLQQYFSEHSAN